MFTRLLQASNDKLLSDLREEVEKKLERVVGGEVRPDEERRTAGRRAVQYHN